MQQQKADVSMDTPIQTAQSIFSRLREGSARSTMSSDKLDSRFEMLRTLSLPPPLVTSGSLFASSGARVCSTPLPTPGRSPVERLSSIPDDWRILASLQFFSPTAFDVATGDAGTDLPSAVMAFSASTVPEDSLPTTFRRAAMHWSYPDAPLPAALSQLRIKDAGVNSFYAERVRQWLVAARNALDMLNASHSQCFYVQVCAAACHMLCFCVSLLRALFCLLQFPDNLALFRRNETGLEALIARSSSGMRKQLVALDVPFEKPLCPPEDSLDVDSDDECVCRLTIPPFLCSVTKVGGKGLLLPQVWVAGDVSSPRRSRRCGQSAAVPALSHVSVYIRNHRPWLLACAIAALPNRFMHLNVQFVACIILSAGSF